MSKAKTGDVVLWAVLRFEHGAWWTCATFESRRLARRFHRIGGYGKRIAKVVISK